MQDEEKIEPTGPINPPPKSGFVFSLKGKVLFGLALLIATVIAINTFYSYTLFLEDKTNYIFENGLQRVEEIADRFLEPINQSINKINPFILIASQNPKQFQEMINSEERIHMFAFSGDNNNKKVFFKEREDRSGNDIKQALEKWWQRESKNTSVTNGIKINGLNLSGKSYVHIKVGQEQQVVSFVMDFSDIISSTQNNEVFNFYIPGLNGVPFFNNSSKLPPYIGDLIKQPIAKGVKEVSVEGKEFLVAYVKFPALGFALISEIAKEKAFAIAKDLQMKSTFFGLAVLGVALILGLLFSLQVTKPINCLVEATKWVAEGDFSKRVRIRSNDEFKVLGKSFNFMSSEIENIILQLEQANEQLEDYNKNLERMVEERTAELKKANDFIATMINSLDQGLLVFDKELNVADIHTKACEDLFGQELHGKRYPELLKMSEKESDGLLKWANIVFEEKIPFSSASGLGPQKFVEGETPEDENFKHIALEYHPMKGEEGIENIVAVATDKTDEVRAIEAFKEKEAFVEMIMKLIHSKKQFYSFLDDVNEILGNLKKELSLDNPHPNNLLINYHSLNGGFGTYSVFTLQKMARACEQYIVDNRDTESGLDLQKLRVDYDNFMKEYDTFLKELENIFGEKRDIVEIDKNIIMYFSEVLEKKTDTQTALLFKEYFEKEAVEEHFEGYKDLVHTLSVKLEKPISPLKIKNGDVRVPPEKTKEFFNSLVHLFRNCVDHGIESPDVRKERQKPEQGKIIVAFDKKRSGRGEETLIVKVQDDGGGIDPNKIREKWRSLHPEDNSIDDLKDEEVIYKIFDPTFSTAEEVTEVSGRGVGMSAIKEVIDKNGGTLEVLSQVGKGSVFRFRLPLS